VRKRRREQQKPHASKPEAWAPRKFKPKARATRPRAPEMLASRATWLDRDENFGLLAIWVAGHGLQIFRPEPRGDRFLDVGECFLLVLSLRHTSGQGRAFDHKPTIFRLVELHMENHADILPVKCGREVTKGWATRPVTSLPRKCGPLAPIRFSGSFHVDPKVLLGRSDACVTSQK
jgi:hypothetical protein